MGQDHICEAHLLKLGAALDTPGFQRAHVQSEGILVSIQTWLAATVPTQPGQCHCPCPPAHLNIQQHVKDPSTG